MQNGKIYLAGKVGGVKHQVIAGLETPGIEFVCSDGGNHSEHAWGSGSWSYSDVTLSGLVQREFIDVIHQCKGLFAILDTPDSFGAIAEIAYASAIGLPCALFIFDPDHNGGKSAMADAYWFVSNFPNVRTITINSFDDAAWLLQAILATESPMEMLFFFGVRGWHPKLSLRLHPQAKFPTGKFTYRVDFLYEHNGKRIAIEIDGHEAHKSRDQRTHDARKDRFLKSQGVEVMRFTGTELHADMRQCVEEFAKIVQGDTDAK